MNPLRIGLIGLDTSHVVAFARAFNDPSYQAPRTDGRITVAWPGGSPDVPLSCTRVPQYTRQLQEQFGVKMLDTPEAVAEQSDLLFIETIDGRAHLPLLQRTLAYRRPTFIDKPLAHSSADARRMFQLAQDAGVALMSCSSLRYAEALIHALADTQLGNIVGCDVFGPVQEVEIPPGLFWYGIHQAEILFAVMGVGCAQVRATRNDQGELIVARWSDGRLASMRGLRHAHSAFGLTLHREKGAIQTRLDPGQRHYYDLMLDAIMRTLPHGQSDIPSEQTLEIIRFLEAANQSRRTDAPVDL